MRRIWSLTKRNGKEIVRDPVSLIFLLGLPVVMEILFYYLFHSLTAQFEMRYLAPGLVGFAHTFLALFISILVSTDRETAFITRIYTTPVTSYEFILGYLLIALPLGLAQSVIVLLVGGIIDISFFSFSLLAVFPASLLSILLFASLGILLGSLCSVKAVGGVASILITGQSVLSGMWFPIEGLSGFFVKLMELLPFKNICVILQQLAVPSIGDFSLLKPILILLAYTILSIVLSCFFFVRNSKAK